MAHPTSAPCRPLSAARLEHPQTSTSLIYICPDHILRLTHSMELSTAPSHRRPLHIAASLGLRMAPPPSIRSPRRRSPSAHLERAACTAITDSATMRTWTYIEGYIGGHARSREVTGDSATMMTEAIIAKTPAVKSGHTSSPRVMLTWRSIALNWTALSDDIATS